MKLCFLILVLLAGCGEKKSVVVTPNYAKPTRVIIEDINPTFKIEARLNSEEAGSDEYFLTMKWEETRRKWAILHRQDKTITLDLASDLPVTKSLKAGLKHILEMRELRACKRDFSDCPLAKRITVDLTGF